MAEINLDNLYHKDLIAYIKVLEEKIKKQNLLLKNMNKMLVNGRIMVSSFGSVAALYSCSVWLK